MAAEKLSTKSYEAFVNRELSWLQFARRVLEMAEDPAVPLLERVKFVGIVGMLHDEFFMKRMSGLKRQITRGEEKLSIDGRTPREEHAACRAEVLVQTEVLDHVVGNVLRPALAEQGVPILDWSDLDESQKKEMRNYFESSVLPILTPLAVDAEHPFPFIASQGLMLAVTLNTGKKERFVCLKVPANRDRWVPLPGGGAYVPLEQVIAANLDHLFPDAKTVEVSLFRVTRGAEGESDKGVDVFENPGGPTTPGSIISQVTDELKARKFAGEVRLEVASNMPKALREWLREQIHVEPDEVYLLEGLAGPADLLAFRPVGRPDLYDPKYKPVTHPRLAGLPAKQPAAIFREIQRGDILLHHPYQSFETSVLRFLESAAYDDSVLAIKLTIYRTSSDSPIVLALAEAARRGKEVAVLVEITARFDEAPNIKWGRYLENEGVHVAYGVEKLKTHVKAALVVREEDHGVRRYVHVGTGNYHGGTARLYTDLGMLSCDPDLAADVAAVFNELTSGTPCEHYRKMLVAPHTMRDRFHDLIQREIEHAEADRRSGIQAKMNQLQDPAIIRHLYRASQAGVPVDLNIRGLCSLRPGVEGLSENIRVFSTLGRFLEHARVYRFENDGDPEFFIGSADWMKRNLDRRVETISPVRDAALRRELDEFFGVYATDDESCWDMASDGTYTRRRPTGKNKSGRSAQRVFMERA
ncbi:MAG: polyphosphate kinase 1 [Thermoanaerobaculales bacterium]|nr:polyphosphate kinase 1 [Thermoanaerobaculales bacterium]